MLQLKIFGFHGSLSDTRYGWWSLFSAIRNLSRDKRVSCVKLSILFPSKRRIFRELLSSLITAAPAAVEE
jgi:hypothetical protein